MRGRTELRVYPKRATKPISPHSPSVILRTETPRACRLQNATSLKERGNPSTATAKRHNAPLHCGPPPLKGRLLGILIVYKILKTLTAF